MCINDLAISFHVHSERPRFPKKQLASSSIAYSDSGIGYDDMATCISIVDVECEDHFGSSGAGKAVKGGVEIRGGSITDYK